MMRAEITNLPMFDEYAFIEQHGRELTSDELEVLSERIDNLVLRGVRVVVVARAGSRTWGETYTRSPKFATTTAVGGRAFRARGSGVSVLCSVKLHTGFTNQHGLLNVFDLFKPRCRTSSKD